MGGKCFLIPELGDIKNVLDKIIKPGDLLLTMGAGDIWRYNESYVNHIKNYD